MQMIDKEKLLEWLKNTVSDYRKDMNRYHADTDVYKGYESAIDEIEHIAKTIESGTFDIKEEISESPIFQIGDRVKHKKDKNVYSGKVIALSKTGKTVRVQWERYNTKVYMFGEPWPVYYKLEMLIKEEPTHADR